MTSERLTPGQALDRVSAVLEMVPQTTVVGIAGPGDPLANPEKTFRTFELIKTTYPDVQLCLSTNGLALPDYVDDITALGIEHVTVTVNAIDPEVGARIYPWVRYQGRTYRGVEASEILLARQQVGLAGLAERDVLVKVNTVLIRGVNDDHIPLVAKKVHDLGALLINVMPLIPVKGTPFEGLRTPTLAERRALQEACEVDIQVMRHCRQCRADAVGLLGEDRSSEFTKEKVAASGGSTPDLENRRQVLQTTSEVVQARRHLQTEIALQAAPLQETLFLAVCSHSGGEVNQHFGKAHEFLIYRADAHGLRFLEARQVDRYCTGPADCGNERKIEQIIDMLRDCQAVLATRFGMGPEYELRAAGIEPIVSFDLIERAMAEALTLLAPKPTR